jgi:hypothetical protein
VRTAPAAAGRNTETILVNAQAAAASTPGSLDPTFGNGGKVLTPGGGATDAILQPNGDIVVSGGFGVARLLPTGNSQNNATGQSFFALAPLHPLIAG